VNQDSRSGGGLSRFAAVETSAAWNFSRQDDLYGLVGCVGQASSRSSSVAQSTVFCRTVGETPLMDGLFNWLIFFPTAAGDSIEESMLAMPKDDG